MVENVDVTKVLFLDVECVSEYSRFEELPDHFQDLWEHKARSIFRKGDDPWEEGELAASYQDRAAIYAEFGKIMCISVGFITNATGEPVIRLKSFAGDDEVQILKDFGDLLEKSYQDTKSTFLCGHNIREFDIPYICRRMVKHQMPLPTTLQIHGKKPWELEHFLDTMSLWKFGDWKSYTSLKLLAAVLGFPSPKDDIDGSEVGRVYWEDKDVDRIALYCEKDVLATAQLLLRYKRMPLLTPEQVVHVSQT
jgi:DNA polymerase elongation subunit (family B)